MGINLCLGIAITYQVEMDDLGTTASQIEGLLEILQFVGPEDLDEDASAATRRWLLSLSGANNYWN